MNLSIVNQKFLHSPILTLFKPDSAAHGKVMVIKSRNLIAIKISWPTYCNTLLECPQRDKLNFYRFENVMF